MKKSNKAIIISLGFVLFSQWLTFSHSGWGMKAAFLIIFFLLSFVWAEKKYLKTKILFRHLLPFLLMGGVLSFLVFEKIIVLEEIMVLFASFCLYLFYSRLEIPLPKEEARQVTYHWLDLCILLSIYLISLAVYQLVFFASLPLWVLVLCLAVLGGLLFGYGLWARRVEGYPLFLYLMLFILIVLEVFLILSFWREALPIYKALILALLYYIYMGLLDIKLRKQRLKSQYLGYLVFAILIFTLIIFSVDWRTFS